MDNGRPWRHTSFTETPAPVATCNFPDFSTSRLVKVQARHWIIELLALPTGELAVLAILMQRGAAAPLSAVQMALKHAPQSAGEPQRVPGAVDLNAMLGAAFPDGLDRSEPPTLASALQTKQFTHAFWKD